MKNDAALQMNPNKGFFVKVSETVIFYPFHTIIYYQHINNVSFINTIKNIYNIGYFSRFYSGLPFNVVYAPINKFIDLEIYKKYGSTTEGALICSTVKSLTYPIHTIEVFYNINRTMPKFIHIYNGYSFFFLSNSISYVLWYKLLERFNTGFAIKNKILKDGVVGLTSGLIVDLLMNPIRVLRTNLQNNLSIRNIAFGSFYNRGIVPKLMLSAIQSAYFNVLIQRGETR